jgi:multidrug efflux pump subunit AcrA (membrane-fusion protein)
MRFLFVIFILILNAEAFAQHSNHKVKDEEGRLPIEVPQEQQKRIGLKTAPVESKPVVHTIKTVGVVTADQTKEAHIHTRINGWIEQIFADYVGKPVKMGAVLFDLYAPELVTTQEEYLAARKQGKVGKEIAKAALDRLKLWDVPQKEIDRLKKTGKSKRTISFESPIDAYIVQKAAIQGMYITPQLELYHLADLSEVWVIATLYEYDLAVVSKDDQAVVKLPYDSKEFKGTISFIFPEIEEETRTAKARIIIKNEKLVLRPGMYTNIEITKDLGKSIVVSEDAVIDTGARRIVFVKSGPTRFEPREIKIGPRVGNEFVVLSGLKEKETIVTSAHFLIDAESKFRAAIGKGAAPKGHGSHGGE